MACTSDKCAGRYGKCGGYYFTNGQSSTPKRKMEVKQCCDAAFECVQFRDSYFQCRPKQREALANWNNTVHTCSAPLTPLWRCSACSPCRCVMTAL